MPESETCEELEQEKTPATNREGLVLATAPRLLIAGDGAVSSTLARLNLKVRLETLDDQRLAAMPDGAMVAEMVQRKYLADLRENAAWQKKNKPFKFDRRRRRKK